MQTKMTQTMTWQELNDYLTVVLKRIKLRRQLKDLEGLESNEHLRTP